MNLQKGSIVTLTHPKTAEQYAGVVELSTAQNLTIVFDTGEEHFRVYSTKGTPHTREQLIAGLKIASGTTLAVSDRLESRSKDLSGSGATIKKGDIVSFEFDGKKEVGRVIKGGKTPVAAIKGSVIKGPAATFTHCEAVPVKGDEALSDWDVSNIVGEGMGMEGPRSKATVTYKGSTAFYAIDDGDGGPVRFEPASKKKEELVYQFTNDIKGYIKAKGANDIMSDELWPQYKYEIAVSGLSFADYLK
jgi:hypothetical protein